MATEFLCPQRITMNTQLPITTLDPAITLRDQRARPLRELRLSV